MGSEMCIRDRLEAATAGRPAVTALAALGRDLGVVELIEIAASACLLYTSDAADDLLCVDLGGRRLIKKKNPTL